MTKRRGLPLENTGCTDAAGALSWQQLTVLATAFKSASSSSSSGRIVLSEAAEVMLKVGTGASVLPFPWQVSSANTTSGHSHHPFTMTGAL